MQAYALVRNGGKQYRVKVGQKVRLEKIEAPIGEALILDQVLLVSKEGQITVGAPLVKGAKVSATVIEQGRAKKVTIIKFRRRQHSRKKQGHRQYFTEVKVTAIDAA